jgi:hypothetical protein
MAMLKKAIVKPKRKEYAMSFKNENPKALKFKF